MIVVNQIRCIGNDPALKDEVLRQAHQQVDAELAELVKELRRVEKELARQHAEILKMAVERQANSAKTARIADLHDHVARGEIRLTELRNEIADREREKLEPQDIEAAFTDFDNVWATLIPREQAQLISLLVARVEFDAIDNTIEVSFHPSAIKTLAERQLEEAA